MKRFAIIALLVAALAAFILIPIFRGSGTGDSESGFPATFNFEENLETTYGQIVPVAFTIHSEDIQLLELIYNDSVFKTWNAPKGQLKFDLPADYFGVGAKVLVLRAKMKDGSVEEDSRVVRVVSDISPKILKATVVTSYPHNQSSYTQGLEFNEGELYEGTGNPQNGESASMVGKVALTTGAIGLKNGLDATYFGEGITILGDNVYQLTWKNGKCFVYNKKDMTLSKDFTYTGEGWGLCNDGKQLIMSDGSERITFRDPLSFNTLRTIEVYDNIGPRINLNELEYIDGKIYANIWQSEIIVVIDPLTGKVLEEIDASALAPVGRMGGEVLNGIAYNPATKKLYMTGKYWGKVMEVTLSE